MAEHLNRFTLERLLAADLPASEATAAAQHLATCPACQAAREVLAADQTAFAAEVPYAPFRIEHERRRASRPRRFAGWIPALAAAGATAALLFAVLPVGEPTERPKGDGVALSFALVDQGALAPGLSGDTVPAGATLQLAYDAGAYTHLAIVGLDAKGGVSQYFPNGMDELAPLPAGRKGRLPFSLTLDPFTGSERFFAVFGAGPTPLGPLLAAARRLAGTDPAECPPLDLDAGLAQASFWIRQR